LEDLRTRHWEGIANEEILIEAAIKRQRAAVKELKKQKAYAKKPGRRKKGEYAQILDKLNGGLLADSKGPLDGRTCRHTGDPGLGADEGGNHISIPQLEPSESACREAVRSSP
jgi:hypothetical protein